MQQYIRPLIGNILLKPEQFFHDMVPDGMLMYPEVLDRLDQNRQTVRTISLLSNIQPDLDSPLQE